ncbi:unnamed protein product [Thelazia callipaeda]|uniref:FYVE-type domain-containing protein n=1 Tax=Thelazia callipaeda TaxID=103827 RepID=A0A0N5CXC7_THECL|nr:unnamed protein product [Thelazia callipaeda]
MCPALSKVDSDVVLTNGKYADMEQYLSRWDMDSVSSVVQEQMSEDSVGQISFITTKEEIIGTTEVRAEQAIDKSDSDTKIQSDLDFHTKIQASEKNIDEVVPNNGKSTKLRMADLFADVNPIYGAQHERAVNAKEDLSPDNVQQVMDECVSDGTVSIKHSSSSSCHPFTNTGSEENIESFSNSVTVRKSKDGNNAEIKEEEESKEMECSDDKLSSDYEKPSGKLEGTQAISVVLSTHDISQNSEFKYLTESERQLGKKQPVWIADKETLSCMICCVKFTVFIRRHHCRCCGRVLCANCTSQKATLLYTNNPKKEHRVCDPCFETLRRIEEYERKTSTSETAIVNDSLNSSDVHQETSRITKPVLKLKTRSENAVMSNDNQNASMGIGGHGNASVKRTVTFLDGLHPGDISNDETQTLTADLSPAKPKKHGSRKQHVSRRLQQLQIAEESACFLPQISCKINDKPVTDDVQQRVEGRLYLRSTEGKIIECSDIKEQIALLRNFNPLEVLIFRNLWCIIKLCKCEFFTVWIFKFFLFFVMSEINFLFALLTDDIITTDQNKTVMCIVSRGMTFVGLDEIFLAYYCDEDLKELPIYHLWRIYEIYENALSPQNESSDEELGIRPAHFRVPALNHTILFSNMKEPISRDILLFRPSTQVFDNLLIPSSPFLVAVFIHQSETIWANVIPQRLLIRIGLQLKFYPTPVINDFNRKPVYNSSFDTSVLKMFNDFRNWRFQMPFIPSSTLIIQNDCECILSIPNWALDKIAMLINKNRNMIAWALDFNADADSYLVCKQSDSGSFESQVFTHGIVSRKVIGASFVIIDGALKAGGEPFIVNVLEDGVAMRFRSDVMESLIETLLVEKGFELKSTTMKISIKWSSCYIQRHDCDLVSPIDGFSLIGCYEYGLKKSRVLGSFYPIPNQVGWSLRLVSVYNIDKGRFAQRVQSKVFSVSEQVTARIAVTLVPFVDDLIKHDLRYTFRSCDKIYLKRQNSAFIMFIHLKICLSEFSSYSNRLHFVDF